MAMAPLKPIGKRLETPRNAPKQLVLLQLIGHLLPQLLRRQLPYELTQLFGALPPEVQRRGDRLALVPPARSPEVKSLETLDLSRSQIDSVYCLLMSFNEIYLKKRIQ